MKRTLSLFLLLCLLPGILPLGAFATQPDPTEATAEEWNLRQPDQCGNDMTWSFSGDTLTVSGTGEMDDYPDGDAPWLEHKDSIVNLVISGNVTSIGACAFADYDSLKKVSFGAAMHTIGYRAFYDCDSLTTFTLPATFRKFGEECFFSCSSLREIRCLGGMPSFKASCLWDCPVSVFYPTTNPWPAEYVTPLFQSYQGKLQIFMGDGIEEAGKSVLAAETVPVETVPETTVPETTVPETTVPETTQPAPPVTQPAEETLPEPLPTEATEPAEPEWIHETQPEPEKKPEKNRMGLWFGLFLITGTLTLVLIGALVFRRRSY